MTFTPNEKILDNYADILINFALNTYQGIKKGDVVLLQVPECAKPLLISLRRAVLNSGGHPIVHYSPDNMTKEYYDLAEEHQINFFPEKYMKGLVDQIDHLVFIIAETDKHELSEVDPKMIMSRGEVYKPYFEWRNQKENEGKFTWTLALYGTESMAKEANLSLEEYWGEIIKACYLDCENPVQKWKETIAEIERVKNTLNNLNIEQLHVKGENIDLIVGIGKNREWMGGSGRNIPSFEVFISPDYRVTSGFIKFNQPLYRYGTLIKDVFLRFENGKVIEATASKGENVLREMIAVPGANQIGEFSLTDSRLSHITKFMAETLFDENMGGEFGNTHIALGNSYKDSYPGDPSSVKKEEWDEMGYNDSSVHTDIISTENREVTAVLSNGEEKLIYKDGKFTI